LRVYRLSDTYTDWTSITFDINTPAPIQTTLQAPANGAIVVNDTVTFQWTRLDYATYYGLVFIDLHTGANYGTLWYTSDMAGCPHTGQICSITLAIGNGEFLWGIIPWNIHTTNYIYQEGITPTRTIYNLGL
jgi:hypothetical protein